ncbi:MAG: hypothetical protein GY754_35170 [bacterium]|nr:hypothetical protein [bacterium]
MFFGEFLIKKSAITKEQLKQGLSLQKRIGSKIGEIFVEMGLLNSSQLNKYLKLHLLNVADNVLKDSQYKDFIAHSV